MPLQKDGVILVAQDAAKFVADMKAATNAYQRFIDLGEKAPAAAKSTAGALQTITKGAKTTTGSLASLFKGFGLGAIEGMGLNSVLAVLTGGIGGLGAIAGQAAIGGIQKLVGGLSSVLKESIMISGRVNELGLVTQLLGQRAGLTSEKINEYVKGVVDAGIRTDVAQNLIAQMARQQLNLADATKLARVAQDAAILSMSDSSEALSRIQYGIQTYQPEVLRTAGLNINMQQSFEKLKKSLNLKRELTEAEKQQAALNAVLAEGARIAGTYELAMKSPAKALRSLPRYFWEIKSAIGAPFQQAFGTVVATITKLTKTFLAAVQEGGVLYPLLIKLGVAASFLADGFAAAVDVVLPIVERMVGSIEGGITGIIERAFNWGAEIVIQFSQGIIDAASTVLSKAIQFVGSILINWLAPGSPPKVAPKLREWGVGWIAELFAGVPEAMTGVLKSLQGPLQTLFEGPDFARLSKQITGLLGQGDRKGVLEALTGADADFGPLLADLAKGEFHLADAIEAVTKAEEDLAAAQERMLAVQGMVSAETDEYNRLLREGASQATLDAQLARINAAEEERKAALAAEKAAEGNLEKREAAVGTAQDEVARLKEILEQVLLYNRALTEQEKLALAGKVGKGGVPTVKRPTFPVGDLDIGGAIGKAIDMAKGKIKAKFGELIGSIREVWENGLAELRAKWGIFVAGVGIAWDRLKEKFPFLQTVEDWIIGLPEKISIMVSEGWDRFKTALSDIWDFITIYVSPVLKDLATIAFELVKGAVLDQILKWQEWWDLTAEIRQWMIDNLLPTLRDALPGALAELRRRYVEPLVTSFGLLKDALVAAHKWFGKLITLMTGQNMAKADRAMKWWRGRSPSPMAVGIQTAADAMERMASVSMPKFNAAMSYRGGGGGATYRQAGSTTNQNNQFNFNTTNNTGMDQALFEAAVTRVIRRALAGAA